MNKWKQSIMRGDTEYRLRCFGSAILMYNQALDQALYEFQDVFEQSRDRAVSQVVLSHLSLAACYVAVEELERASDCYIQALGFLEQLLGHAERGDETLFGTVLRAVSHVNSVWQDFVRQHRTRLDEEQQLRYRIKVGAIFTSESRMAQLH